MSQLIAALGENVKAAGKDRWMAKCPVHNDADFAMSIKLRPNNSYTITCYACGANGVDVYRHMGIDLEELFGKERDTRIITPKQQEEYREDKFFIAIFEADKAKGLRPRYEDWKRYNLALKRIEGIRIRFNKR